MSVKSWLSYLEEDSAAIRVVAKDDYDKIKAERDELKAIIADALKHLGDGWTGGWADAARVALEDSAQRGGGNE